MRRFREIAEPLIGRKVPMPQALSELFARPAASREIEPDLVSPGTALLRAKR